MFVGQVWLGFEPTSASQQDRVITQSFVQPIHFFSLLSKQQCRCFEYGQWHVLLCMCLVFGMCLGAVGGKSLIRTWCMQPFPCTCDQLQRIQRTRHRPTVHRTFSLPLDRQYTGQVQVAVSYNLSWVGGRDLTFSIIGAQTPAHVWPIKGRCQVCNQRTGQNNRVVKYTVVHKKTCHFIFDHNSHVSWWIFTLVVPSAYFAKFRIFFPHILHQNGPHILRKISAINRYP